MNKSIPIIAIIIGLVVAATLLVSAPKQKSMKPETGQVNNSLPVITDDRTSEEPTPDVVNTTTGEYVEYSEQTYDEARKSGKKVVLFFHADWCPTCRSAEKNILSNIDEIPDDLIILKTNYDKESDLKKKHGITYQHTFVQVDSDGNEITKWSGGALKEILEQIK